MSNDQKRGLLLIFSGPSGCGKGTIVSRLLAERDDTVLSVSVTTRAPRPGETDGVEYYFRSREQVEQMIAQDELLEYAEYSGNYYGTPKAAVERLLDEGKNVILEIEVQGAQKVMARVSDYVSIFLAMPSLEELERRLRGRGTETEDRILRRMAAVRSELDAACHYQYVVVNDDVDAAVERVNAILKAEQLRYERMKTVMEGLSLC